MFATKPSIVHLLFRFGPVLSLHCCNPLVIIVRKSIELDILITFIFFPYLCNVLHNKCLASL